MHEVILMIGTSGSGKTTWAINYISLHERTKLISLDDMRIEFTGNINDKSMDEDLYTMLVHRCSNFILDGYTVIVDSTNLQKERRRNFMSALRSILPFKITISYKLMELDPALAKERIKEQFKRREFRANVLDETIDRHAELYKQMLIDIKEEDIHEIR